MRLLLALAMFVFGFGPAWGAPSANPEDSGQKTRLIIGFQPEFTAEQRDQLVKGLGLKVVDTLDEPIRMAVVETPKGSAGVKSVQLKATPGVANVEPDEFRNWLDAGLPNFAQTPLMTPVIKGIVAAMPDAVPPLVPIQTGEFPWGILRVKADQVWDKNNPKTMGAGVRVGVIDTGIDCTHPNLACDDKEGVNLVDPKASPMDDNGHGTHVSGTIAGKWDGQGVDLGKDPADHVVGVAPLARLVPIKVLNGQAEGYLSNVIKGILWAADPKNHIQVVNMSLGGPTSSFFMHLAVMWARHNGVTIVAAAGNSGPKDNTVGYPGGYSEVIAVAASARNPMDSVAGFSSRGMQIKFIAPGVDVVSTVPGGGLAKHAGTSMATPHVTGLAALAIAQGAKTPDQVLAALTAAAKPLDGLALTEQGLGMIDATRIVHKTLADAR